MLPTDHIHTCWLLLIEDQQPIPLPFGIRTWRRRYTCLLLLISMLWHRQAIFESKGDKLSSYAECRIRVQSVSGTESPADWMSADNPTELSRIKLHTYIRTYVRTYVQTHTDTHRHTQTHTQHTHRHIFIYLLECAPQQTGHLVSLLGMCYSKLSSLSTYTPKFFSQSYWIQYFQPLCDTQNLGALDQLLVQHISLDGS